MSQDDPTTPEDEAVPGDDRELADEVEPVDETEPVEVREPVEEREPAVVVRRTVRVRRVLAATASALGVLGLAAAVVLADDRVPVPDPPQALARVVEVPAADQVLVCPGPPRGVTEGPQGEDVVYDPQFAPAPEGSETGVTVAVAPGREATVGDTVARDPVTSVPGAGAVTVTSPGGADAPPVAASTLTLTEQGDLRGLAAAPCTRPADEHWLVGGSTALGSSARLTLQNPGRTAASVTVDMWGPAGPVEIAGAPEFLVPPGESRVVLLEGVAAEQRRIVVRTSVTGGLVAANLEVGELRGVLPAGVDLVTSGAPPATEQVVVGLHVPRTEPDGVDVPVLRLLAPDAAADVEIAIVGKDGPVELPGADEVRLDAGAVLDVPLGGLPAGAYAVRVRSPEPVVAGAMTTRGDAVGGSEESVVDPVDRAWLPAQGADGEAVVAVPVGDVRDVVLVGPGTGRAEAVVTVRSLDGEEDVTEVVVPARSTARVRVEASTAVAVEVAGEGVRWAVVVLTRSDDGTMVTSLTPAPRAAVQDTVGVVVR